MINYQQVIIASSLIHTGPGFLTGLVCSIGGAAAGYVICYNNTTPTGTVIFRVQIAPESVQQPFAIFYPDRYAPRFSTGLYVTLSGLGMVVNLWARGV